MAMWSRLNEAKAPEADVLASAIIGQGFEPSLKGAEALDFYRQYLIVNGYIDEVPDKTQTH